MSDLPLSARLLRRLKANGLVPEDAVVTLRRTDASRSQKNEGAWTWTADTDWPAAPLNLGSQFTMRQCMAARVWDVSVLNGDTTVEPCMCPDEQAHKERYA